MFNVLAVSAAFQLPFYSEGKNEYMELQKSMHDNGSKVGCTPRKSHE